MSDTDIITPPSTASEASARLTQLEGDKAWSARLLAGDPTNRKEWSDLTLLAAKSGDDDIDRAMSGALPDVPDGRLKTMAGTADMLRAAGVEEIVIRETLSDSAVTQAEYDATKIWYDQHMADKEFTKRWLNGDVEARKQMMLAHVILSKSIKDKVA